MTIPDGQEAVSQGRLSDAAELRQVAELLDQKVEDGDEDAHRFTLALAGLFAREADIQTTLGVLADAGAIGLAFGASEEVLTLARLLVRPDGVVRDTRLPEPEGADDLASRDDLLLAYDRLSRGAAE